MRPLFAEFGEFNDDFTLSFEVKSVYASAPRSQSELSALARLRAHALVWADAIEAEAWLVEVQPELLTEFGPEWWNTGYAGFGSPSRRKLKAQRLRFASYLRTLAGAAADRISFILRFIVLKPRRAFAYAVVQRNWHLMHGAHPPHFALQRMVEKSSFWESAYSR